MTEISDGSDELFPPNMQERADQLLALGYLDTEVEFCGISYGLRTLTGEEELLAGLIAKPYLESFGQLKAWAWANVGIALAHVDGDADFCPPSTPNSKAFAQARFNYVTQWFWPVGEYLFEEYKALEAERDAIVEVIRGKSLGSPPNSFDWRDSLTGPDDSENREIIGLLGDD